MTIDLPTQYDPKAVEQAIYQKWLDAKAFHAVPEAGAKGTWKKQPFSIVIPPPNVTGALHLGHAINGTIQDILTRYHRMKGDNALWMPGIDHAGIATQAVVEKTIFEKEKKSRHDLGREELVRRIWEWKEQYGTRILSQLASIGASCDWDRTRFTLDEVCAKAVREAFFKMFKDGLIFRGKRLVNWDTHLQTAVADDEIYHETVKGQMTSIRYPVADETQNAKLETQNGGMEYLVVATTRPETMLGDTAVAVHPDDPRYKHLIGKFVIVPLVGRRIPIIGDGLLVDPKFGTGVVKVTPAHDPNDYATGQRHNLEKINLLTADGKVNEFGAGEFMGKAYSYTGLKFATAARKAVLADLEALGLIAEVKVHEHEVGHSDRSKTPIEPYLSDQWFVRMSDVESPDQKIVKLSRIVSLSPEVKPEQVPGIKYDAQTWAAVSEAIGDGITSAPGECWEEVARDSDDPSKIRITMKVKRSLTDTVQKLESRGFKAGLRLADGSFAVGLAHAAIDAVKNNRVRITPERYAKGYVDWLFQKRDWCISRQLWWGHRIPVWVIPLFPVGNPGDFGDSNTMGMDQHLIGALDSVRNKIEKSRLDTEIFAQFSTRGKLEFVLAEICVRPGNPDIEAALEEAGFVQDPDVLDTWFSSALWPISTMGWPATGTSEKPEDQLLPYFYPTSVLSTGRDILTLWVARMVMFGLYCHGDVPFRDVYIHATIQDGEGRPMSKSKGNGVDPVDIIGSHGADALRYTLASMATETQDIRMPVVKDAKTGVNTSPKFDVGRNFANKIWNASRFILSNLGDDVIHHQDAKAPRKSDALEDRWILSRLNSTISAAEHAINHYRFAELAEALRTFFWSDLCDWYLEIAKARIRAGDHVVQSILLECLETSLKLLHPIMPFITEEIWSKLPERAAQPPAKPGADMLVMAAWPAVDEKRADAEAESQIGLLQELISQIRDIQNRYPNAKGMPAIFKPQDEGMREFIERSRVMIESLANIKIAENDPAAKKPENAAVGGLPGRVQIFIAGVIDKTAETAKLTKRKGELEKLILGSRNKLGNEGFVAKAPANIIQGLRDQLAKLEEELGAVEKNLRELGA